MYMNILHFHIEISTLVHVEWPCEALELLLGELSNVIDVSDIRVSGKLTWEKTKIMQTLCADLL